MFTILKRFKKFITLILCAALFNACVMPSAAIFAAKQPINQKREAKPSQPQSDKDKATKKPTLQESWQKVINLELKSLTRDDAWNLGTSTIGTLSACVLAYALFRSKPAAENLPHNKPNIIPNIPAALQNITDDIFGMGYEQKIKAICNEENRKQLKTQKLNDIKNQLVQEIAQANDQSVDGKKQLIDHCYNYLQEHLGNKIIIDTPIDTDTDKTQKSTIEPKKPTILYPHATQAHRIDIHVPRQTGLLCAIHALHDGNYINDIFTQDDSSINKKIANDETLLNNNSYLLSDLIAQKRIDTDSSNVFKENCKNWTSQTGNKRKADACEKYISHLLHACMTLTQEEQDAQAGFINAIKYFFTRKPLHTLTNKEKNSCALISSILKDSVPNGPIVILEWVKDNINLADLYNDILRLAHDNKRNLTEQQQNDLFAFVQALDTAKLNNHFGQALIINEDFLAKAASHVYYYHEHLSSDFSGENLDSQELGILVEQIDKKTQFKYNKGDLAIDFFDMNNPATSAYNLNGKISIINDTANMVPDSPDGTTIAVIKHQMHQCKKFVHTFMIRLGNVKIGSSTSTHWISATLVRFNNTNHYYMTDSIGANRINDRNVLQLIEALEQPDIQEPTIEILEQSENHNDILDTEATPTSNSTAQTIVIESNINNTTYSDKSELSLVDQAFLNSSDDINHELNKEIIIEDTEATHTNTQHEQFSSSQKLASIQTIAQKGNSCAYHALKNANDILHMLQKPQIQKMEENFNFEAIATRISKGLRSKLSKQKIITLFDEDKKSGEWREISKKNRLPGVLKESINDKLLKCLVNTDPVDSTVRSCLRNIAHACASQLASNNNDSIDLDENVNLQDLFITMLHNNNPKLLENNKEEDYKVCIALLNGDELRKQFGQAITAKTALEDNNTRARELLGNDLDADELQYLIDYGNVEINKDNLENAQPPISIIARIESSDFVAGNSYALSEVLPSVREKMKNKNYSHAFLIRTGFVSVEDNQAQRSSHWICVILYRVNGNNHWIVADSLNTSNRANDVDVNFLINQLES